MEERVLQVQQGNNSEMVTIWIDCQTMIHTLVNRFRGYEDPEDLTQQAYFGLVRAVELFDPDKDTSFKHYASFWIRKALAQYIRKGALVVVPECQYERMRFLDKEESLEDYPAEVIDNYQRIKAAAAPLSLDRPAGPDADTTIGELLPAAGDPFEEVIDAADREQLRADMAGELEKLTENQRDVIRLRYYDDLTTAQAGQLRRVSKQAISRTEQKALATLRKSKTLQNYLPDTLAAAAYEGVGVANFRRTWTSVTERVVLDLLK